MSPRARRAGHLSQPELQKGSPRDCHAVVMVTTSWSDSVASSPLSVAIMFPFLLGEAREAAGRAEKCPRPQSGGRAPCAGTERPGVAEVAWDGAGAVLGCRARVGSGPGSDSSVPGAEF